ncbi:uncharacterized protein TNIN_17391 [Trichonephila inaurata madagascariensis]|uniref:Insulin-like domain-containing protein n=1 Tax=Trichonephila inaurata madagascariensis TaxID=2747483 RepID=A0A8X6MGZ3_9ARAC|nr:uncharacterized protein TNIN_17391 [Trichonephila inaurata madagascariensis]
MRILSVLELISSIFVTTSVSCLLHAFVLSRSCLLVSLGITWKRILQRIRRYSKMRFWSMSLVCMTLFIIVITSDMGILGFKLCGWRLAETLQMVCKDYGGFYSSHLRHSREVSSGSALERGIYHHARREKRMYIQKRGIVDECCRKHCSFRDILSYCANPYETNENATNYDPSVQYDDAPETTTEQIAK